MSNPTYRPLRDADRTHFIYNDAHAFTMDTADVERWLSQPPTGDLRGLYEGDRLVSQMVLFPFTVMTGVADIACGGIAGVSTPPEERRRGYTERMLLDACAEMRERSMPVAMLHPFKTSFYGRFGWATCQERRLYSGPPERFASFLKRQRGQFERAGEANIAELNEIYTGALRGRFGPLLRDEAWWRKEVFFAGKKPHYMYIWRDESGRGRAYIIYRWEQKPAGTTMMIREIVALDPEARAQLFAFIANHDSQCKEVQFRAPTDAPVNMLLPDPLKCEAEPYFMLRFIDVERALAAYRFPKGVSGALTIAVADDWLTYNSGVYRLEVADGVAHVSRQPDGAEADMRCNVGLLAQFYSRYLRPRTAAAFGMIEAPNRDALALADQLFAGLAPFSSDFF